MTEAVQTSIQLPAAYELRGTLKESNSTSVYRVRDLVHDREAAIKILRHEFDAPEGLLQFRSEFATLASLDHPAIIKVYDFGLIEERYPYFTMEYFEGKKITDFFDGRDWNGLFDVIVQIASGLHHIHQLGIIHLDVKPSNILVNARGKVKIMDFGVSAEAHTLFDRRIRGTLHYMAPEVLRQDQVDLRADLFALGMTLYETVTGALPTFGRPSIEIIRHRLDEAVRKPSAINPHVPDRLEQIILKLLEPDPRHRYSSAAMLLHDVARAAAIEVTPGELLLGSGELLAAPLIGHQEEIDRLTSAIQGAREGKGGGVIVLGPEGMGKSRIVREATVRAQLDGARVFVGRCPVNRKSIYAPFFEIFQQLVRALNPVADATSEIRRILRTVISSPEEGKLRRGEKFRLYNRVVQSIQDFYGYLKAVGDAGSSPLILIVEDLQWADPSSAELFTFLVGEARQSNFLVVGTLTTGKDAEPMVDDGASTSVGQWEQRARESGMTLIEVGPLSEDLVREYVESLLGEESLPHDLIRWIMWESGGSPMLVRRVVDFLATHGYLRLGVDGWSADLERIQNLRIPGGSAAVWSEKLEQLSEEHRRLLETASVMGDHFETSVLTRIAGADAEHVFHLVRQLSAKNLLDTSADGRVLAFPQGSLREAVYAQMPGDLRIAVHQRAARVLETLLLEGAAELLGQVAYHYARGNDHMKGIEYSIRAGVQAASALAHEQAAEFYRIALELMDLSGDHARRLEIRERLGDAYYRNNNFRGAMQVYQFLLKSIQSREADEESQLAAAGIMRKIGKLLARRGESDAALTYFQDAMQIHERLGSATDVAELLNRTAWIHRDRGEFAEAERTAQQASRMIGGDPLSPLHGYVEDMLGEIAYGRGDWETARVHFEKAFETAERLDCEQLRRVSSRHLGNVLWKVGEWDAALQHHRRNLDKSETDGDLWDLVTAYNNVAVIELSRGNFHAAAQLFQKSYHLGEKLGSPESESVALEYLGQSLERLGRWNDAMARYQQAVRLEGFDENRPSRVSVYVPLARLTARRGDIARALQYAQRVYDLAERTRDENLLAEASYVLGVIEKRRENYEEAAEHIESAMELFTRNGTRHGIARTHALMADVAVLRQRFDDAVHHAREAIAIATGLGDRFTVATSDWMLGRALSFSGSREEGEERFAAAQRAFEDLDTPYELGRLLFDLGLLRDDPEEATQIIRRAVSIFERLQATPDLERARGALFRIRPSGRAAENSVVGLYEIVKIINSTLRVEDVLNRVLEIVLKRIRAERGMILVIDPITSALRTRVVRNIREEDGSKRSPQAVVRDVIETGRSVISADARADERFVDSETVISENIVSILCVPLVIRERIAGAIYVDHREARHLFSQRDLSFLEAFADQAAIAIENARLYEELEQARLRLSLENESLRKEVLVDKHLDSVVGQSEAVARIQFTVRKAAASASTVLIRGESGTGKGLVARIIHNIGPRRNGPFIKFNCAALPETLAESELFGHEKGAFTGAERRKLGRFELANGGTIFLDEIGKVSLAMQAKLLRIVEEKEFERVGGTQTIQCDAKIIAATNLDLEKAIEEGVFREDLFYRLNIIPILLPPLRDRKEDIPLLVEHFIRKICYDLGIEPKPIEPGVLDLFNACEWPGNVRELEATLHRAIVMSNDDILTRRDFYGLISDPNKSIPEIPLESISNDLLLGMIRKMEITSDVYDDLMQRVEKHLIEQALLLAKGKIRETARRLGLARNTLKSKMQKYNLAGNGS